jgi:hypothetical protein
LASACQHDSSADFDDTELMSPGTGGGGATDAGGSDAATAGVDAGGSSSGGSEASAGTTSQGGKAGAGASGSSSSGGKGGASSGGKGGASSGGKAGTDAGGSAPQAGKAGQGGMAGSATAGGGMGGTVVTPPEPMTFETTDIDDTYLVSCYPNMNYGALSSMSVDGNDSDCTYQILIIAPLSGIPAGALVSEATLTLTCTNAGGPITVSYANEAWKELMVRYNTRPEVGASLGTVTCQAQGEEVTINLTSAVKAWLAGEHAANGIYLRTEDSDGTDFDTSEAHTTSTRPVFSVTYTLPVK